MECNKIAELIFLVFRYKVPSIKPDKKVGNSCPKLKCPSENNKLVIKIDVM